MDAAARLPRVDCIYTWAKSQLEERKEGSSSMTEHQEIRAIEGVGLEGDRYATKQGLYSKYHTSCPDKGAWQHVTLFDISQYEEICSKPRMRACSNLSISALRRNIGLQCPPATNILSWVGHEVEIGAALFFVHMHGNPCPALEKTLKAAGFQEAAWDLCGVHAEVLRSGVIRRGDEVIVHPLAHPERIVGPSLLRKRVNGAYLRPSLRAQLMPNLMCTLTEDADGYVTAVHYADEDNGYIGSWPPEARPLKGPIAAKLARAHSDQGGAVTKPDTARGLSHGAVFLGGVALVAAALQFALPLAAARLDAHGW